MAPSPLESPCPTPPASVWHYLLASPAGALLLLHALASLPSASSPQDSNQVSKVVSLETKPVWNHSFRFLQQDFATIVYWSCCSDVGVFHNHMELHRKLISEMGQKGMKVKMVLLRLQKNGYRLPSHDALAQILPDHRNFASEAKTELQNTTYQEQERSTQRAEVTQANKPNINRTYQEVENYRAAMSKMAEDIIALRTQVVALEAENSQLRSDLSLHQDLGRNLLDDTDIDVMTKAEIADRIASLKFKLASETSKAVSQRDRIHQLQNELIKKNDSEKELLKLQGIHQQQQEDLQHHQSRLAKMAALEARVKQQEKVIERMEKALDGKLREKTKQSGDKSLVLKKHRDLSAPLLALLSHDRLIGCKTDHNTEKVESALAAENARLREELDRIHRQPAPVIIQQSVQTKEVLPVKEKLSLLNKLEKAEARVQILEAQLEENSKLWGRQKQEMLTKLSEHRHGFVRTSTTILHNASSVR
ncbi:coiled-coil domain-containing protein 33 [Toxotes jaculatrix]|uniref:coiled-coil domain-containing protein 33 n=1 Tax=Toxotes jaculatrix TaxID=941984 RepID=UPI001B3AA904|nr:coiled-coil domain-containing protein 33 [Toxotes jaculatrix]